MRMASFPHGHTVHPKWSLRWIVTAILVLILFAMAFRIYQLRLEPYLPYDAQESEAK